MAFMGWKIWGSNAERYESMHACMHSVKYCRLNNAEDVNNTSLIGPSVLSKVVTHSPPPLLMVGLDFDKVHNKNMQKYVDVNLQ